MGRAKIEIKYIENTNSRHATFRRRRNGIFKNADELAKQCNVDVAVLLVSPTNLRYTYGSPCFNDVVELVRNPNALSILKSQTKLDRLMEELERFKGYEENSRRRQQINYKYFNMKEIVDMKLEDLVAFKGKLEAFQADSKIKKKKKVGTKLSSG